VEHRYASTSRGLDCEDGFYTFVQSIKNSVSLIYADDPHHNSKQQVRNEAAAESLNTTGTFPGFIARDVHVCLHLRTTPSFRFTRKRISPTCWTRYTTRREISSCVCERIPLFGPFWNGGEAYVTRCSTSPLPRVDDVLLVVGVLRVYPTDERSDLIMTHKEYYKTRVGAERGNKDDSIAHGDAGADRWLTN
jgi:hypothetical protein